MSPLAYFDRDDRAQLSRLPVRIVRSQATREVWFYWRSGRFQSSGFRLWPRSS